mgnify:CR=1 FL=1
MLASIKDLVYYSNYLRKSLLNLLAPQIRLVCEGALGINPAPSRFICQKCLDAMPLAPATEQITNKFYSNFHKKLIHINKAACLLDLKSDFQYINIVYSLKYSRFPDVGIEFGKMLGRILKINKMIDYDAIIPVPIHPARRRERGFNQSEYVAKGISEVLRLPVETNILKRNRYTTSQTLLGSNERKSNVSNAFQISEKTSKITDKSFLLCDDVLTTGSTLVYCAQSLHRAGANRIDVAAIANA